jgi:hypothetical protein
MRLDALRWLEGPLILIRLYLSLQLSSEQSGEQRAGTSSAAAKMLTAGTTQRLSQLVGHNGETSFGYWCPGLTWDVKARHRAPRLLLTQC